MSAINVWERYFRAEHAANGAERRAALVMLIAESENGMIRYQAAVTFFPHRDAEDFAVSYDDYHAITLYEAPGRRSRKREEKLLTEVCSALEQALEGQNARIFWDEPLREARRG